MQLGASAVPRFIATTLLLVLPVLAVAEDNLPTPDYHRQRSDPAWLAEVVQLHGHLGPSVVAGARMGMIGRNAVGAKGYFDVEVTCDGPLAQPPQSCFLDGIQAATGATTGKRTLNWVQADKLVVRVRNTQNGKTVELRPTPALLGLLVSSKPEAKSVAGHGPGQHDHEQLEQIARKIAAMPNDEIASVTILNETPARDTREQSRLAPPACSEAPAASQSVKYLIFWSSPEKAGELAAQVGMKGDGKTRLLGFGLPNATYELEKQLPSRIRSAFAAAREHDMAVMLHFDFHLAWKSRPDLWNWFDQDKPGYNPNNKYNVEWHSWDGPPNKVRYLNHGVLERLPPNMCFTSKRIRAEITRIISKVIGPVLREEIAKLKAEGKEALFAGVLVGLEPSIDDYSQPNPEQTKMMKEDGVPRDRSATGRSWIVGSAPTSHRTISERPWRRSFRKPSLSGVSSSSMRESLRKSSILT